MQSNAKFCKSHFLFQLHQNQGADVVLYPRSVITGLLLIALVGRGRKCRFEVRFSQRILIIKNNYNN